MRRAARQITKLDKLRYGAETHREHAGEKWLACRGQGWRRRSPRPEEIAPVFEDEEIGAFIALTPKCRDENNLSVYRQVARFNSL